MAFADLLLFILLGAIWGCSYMFMSALSPILGVAATATARTLIAGIFLVGLFAIAKVRIDWKRDWKRYLLIGVVNTGLPFLCYCYAVLHVPSSVPAIINSLTPLWGAVFAALLLKDPLTPRKLIGLLLGAAGVVLIALRGAGLHGSLHFGAIAASVLATVCYGFAGAGIKRWASDLGARPLTAASLSFAGLALLPLALASPPPGPVSAWVWAAAALFAVLCSAVAYLIYFRLIARAGVTIALAVTLIVPVFAFLWGYIFLGERVSAPALAGAVLVLGGTSLVITGKRKT